MTRDEFMARAKQEIDNAFSGQRNRMMNLVEQAWAEGKRNAETDALVEVVKEALNRIPRQVIPTQPINVPFKEYPWTITCEGTKPPEPPKEEYSDSESL